VAFILEFDPYDLDEKLSEKLSLISLHKDECLRQWGARFTAWVGRETQLSFKEQGQRGGEKWIPLRQSSPKYASWKLRTKGHELANILSGDLKASIFCNYSENTRTVTAGSHLIYAGVVARGVDGTRRPPRPYVPEGEYATTKGLELLSEYMAYYYKKEGFTE